MLADCELGSNCSSMSNERAQMYYGRRFSGSFYDNLHLENVRTSIIAERKKPLLVTHSKTSISRQNMKLQSNAIVRDENLVRSRYEARRKFFEDLGRQKNSATESKTITTSANKEENVSKQHSMENFTNKNLHTYPVKICDTYLTRNVDTRECLKKANGETHSADIVVHTTKWENIALPNFVTVVNVKETEPSFCDSAFCTNDDCQPEKRVKNENHDVTTIDEKDASVKRESSETQERGNNCLNSMIQTMNEKQQPHVSKTTTENCMKTFLRDNSDNEESSQQLSDLSSNNCKKYSTNHYECDEDKEAPMNKGVNGRATELKKQSICTWIEKSMCENNWPNSSKTEIDNTYESYCDDITKIVESIDVNISSSRTELDALPNTDTCVKYNLDSTNMSLIYSLTPPAVQEESGNDDTSHDLAEQSSEWLSDITRSDNDEALDDYVWIEPTTIKTTECVKSAQCSQDRRTVSSNASSLDSMSERHSASGSDILELPSRTVLELKEIDGEVFHNGINESANEIIADLNAAPAGEAPSSNDALQIAQHILAEIIESVYILLFLDSSIYDLNVAREVVRQFIHSCCYEYSLTEFANQTSVSDVSTIINTDCRRKGFLENLSPDFADYNNETINEKEDLESSAVIEFCTVAKGPPIEKPSALALNFRIIKVSPDERADTLPDAARIFDKNSIDNDRGTQTDRILDKTRYSENVIVSKSGMETWKPCCYCQERDEESTRDKLNCLPPIIEELDETSYDSTTFVLENEESSHHLGTHLVDAVEENSTVNSAKKSISLDDTYTISEVSSIIISDNDETSDVQERCDIWDSSIDCMSYSYDTKEFMRLEKAIADNSPLNA